MKTQKKYKSLFYSGLVVAALFIPFLAKTNYQLLILDQVLVFAIVTLGLNYITGLVGQMNLGMAGIFGIGAYTSALLCVRGGVNAFVGILAAAVAGVILGFVLGYPSLRLRGIYFALTTIGFVEIVRICLNNMTSLTFGSSGVVSIPGFQLFGWKLDSYFSKYYVLLVFLIMAILISKMIIESKWGRSFRAVSDNESSVASCGVKVARTKINAFIISCVFASVGGALYAHLIGFICPGDFNFERSVRILMMLMLGGIGSIPGCILGAAVVIILPETLKFIESYYWMVFSALMLIMIMLRPYGLASIAASIQKKIIKMREAKRGGASNG